MGRQPQVLPFDQLSRTEHAHELAVVEAGVSFSLILVHAPPGAGPALHRHPYAELFVVELGQATFRLGEEEIVVDEGHVVVAPAAVAHGFKNTGTAELRLVAIHAAPDFDTEWLGARDPAWASRRS